MAEDKDKKGGFNLGKGEKRKFNLGKSDNKSKFDLSKSDSKPKFDLSKSDSKSKFDLDKGDSTSKPIINFGKADNEPKPSKPTPSVAKPEIKVGQPTTKSSMPGSQDASSTDEAPSNGGSGKKNWIIAAIVIIAIVCAGIWYSNNEKGETTNEPIEQMASDSTANDAGSTQTAQSSGGASTPLVGEQGESDKSTGSDVVPSRDESAGNSVAAGNQAAQQTKTSAQSNAGSEDASAASTDIPSSAREAAKQVWNGKFGNNPQRRRLLGSRYAEIQREVNRMSRAGNIH